MDEPATPTSEREFSREPTAGVAARMISALSRHRRALVLVAATAAVTLVVDALASVALDAWNRATRATVRFDTDGGPLVAEFLDDEGQTTVPDETVPMQNPVALPAGRHDLRLSGDALLGEQYAYWLEPGEELEADLTLESHLLKEGVEYQRLCNIVEDSGNGSAGADILLMNSEGVRLCDGETGQELWRLKLAEPEHAVIADRVQLTWPWDRAGVSFGGREAVGAFSRDPWVVPSEASQLALPAALPVQAGEKAAEGTFEPVAHDLDGDGFRDLLLAARHQAWLLAVSGQNGAPLWIAARGDAKLEEGQRRRYGINSTVAYPPIAVQDQNGDGVLDVVALFVDAGDGARPHRRWIELLSGGDGETLWRYDLQQEWFQLAQQAEPPYHLRWFHGSGGGSGSSSGGFGGGAYYRRSQSQATRSGTHLYLPTRPQLIDQPMLGDASVSENSPAAPALALFAGKHLVHLDLQTGKPTLEPAPIDVRPHLQPRYADLDGDAHVDVLLTEELPDVPTPAGERTPRFRLSAWSVNAGTLLWQQTTKARFPIQPRYEVPAPDWPIVADLDGDGAGEVIAPAEGTLTENRYGIAPAGSLQVLDGATGKPRWRRELRNIDQQVDHFAVGPDIDQDGWREIFVATLWNAAPELFVDCFSGRDGRTLWRAQHPVESPGTTNDNFYITGSKWYRWGGDGWPQLIIQLRDNGPWHSDRGYLFSAGTGRLVHTARGATDFYVADLQGDQIPDLAYSSRTGDSHRLRAYQGHAGEPWRHLATAREVVGDLDSDGALDLLEQSGSGRLAAYSGLTGDLLWSHDLAPASHVKPYAAAQSNSQTAIAPRIHDLDGDGTPDLLLVATGSFRSMPLVQAISGRNGRRLWRSAAEAEWTETPALVDCRDLDSDGHAEVLVALPTDYGMPSRRSFGNDNMRLWLFAFSGRDGQMRWQHPLTADPREAPVDYELRYLNLEAGYADLSGDGTLDIVLPAQADSEIQREELRAISGADGQVLWRHSLPPATYQQDEALQNQPPIAAGDVDGDGRSEVLFLSSTAGPDPAGRTDELMQVTLLEGATGKPQWQWQTPEDRYSFVTGTDSRRIENRLRPLLLNRASGEQWIAVWTEDGGRHGLHVIDDSGRVVAQSELEGRYYGRFFRPWPLDADSDGNDELLYIEGEELTLFAADTLQPRWQIPATPMSADRTAIPRVAGVVTVDDAVQVIIQGGRDAALRGLDAATGATLWSCPNPFPNFSAIWITESQTYCMADGSQSAALLMLPHRDRPPLARYRSEDMAVGRLGAVYHRRPETESGMPPRLVSTAGSIRPSPTLQPTGHDPRYIRSLPWKPSERDMEQLPMLIASGLFYGFTLAVLPIAVLGSLVHRRRWGMKSVLLLPAVAAVFLTAAAIDLPFDGLEEVSARILFAYFAAGPIWFAVLLLAFWTFRRRWRLVRTTISAAVLASLAMAVLALLVIAPLDGSGLMPGERWSWEGWYGILLPLVFILSWSLTLIVPVMWLISVLRHRRQSTGSV